MAAKANRQRTRMIRSAILSASLLSLVPLVGVMQQGEGANAGVGSTAQAVAALPDAAASGAATSVSTSSVTSQAVDTASKSAAPAATATASSQTTVMQAMQSSYTRTRAS